MKNYIQPGKSIEVTFGADVSSGDPYMYGDLFGVVDHDVDVSVSARGTLCVEGVFELAADAADTFTEGLAVYWNGTDITTDAAAGANPHVGHSLDAAGPAAGTIKVRLTGAGAV